MPPKKEKKEEDDKPPSCATLYVMGCQNIKIKPKANIMQLLPKSPGLYTMTEINLGTQYVGTKNIDALMKVIEKNIGMTRINLRDNGIKNPTVVNLVKILSKHPCVTALDLSGNVDLTIDAGMALLKLVKSNPKVLRLGMGGTKISRDLQNKVKSVINTNRSNTNPDAVHPDVLKKRTSINIQELEMMAAIFRKLDIDRDGTVDYGEFQTAYTDLTSGEPVPAYIDTVFQQMDTNKSGRIELMEYCKAAFPTVPHKDLKYYISTLGTYTGDERSKTPDAVDLLTKDEQQEIRSIFGMYDTDGDGYLSVTELKTQLGKSWIVGDVDEIFKNADMDGNSLLCLEEFMKLMAEYYVS
eukprot:TRINITY_DN67026_c1_g1_i4.p1 TRINITY_DN67026_c1_g1~~TRINITY_DN67026_c1_g1_i4.p1  ORF type:complete len:354 (+),score=22.75 TRINITY_DN67026_c1_g1_i4:50-1111(+)